MTSPQHVNESASRIVVGTLGLQETLEHYRFLDLAWEYGVRRFDCARHYGDSESALGNWLAKREVDRKHFRITCKGGHPESPDFASRLTYDALKRDLTESLQRLRIEYCDTFLVHRDDPSQPTGAIVEAIARLQEEGLCGEIGTTNWSVERLQEAESYAKSHDLPSFTINQTMLAVFDVADLERDATPSLRRSLPDAAYEDWLIVSKQTVESYGPMLNECFDEQGALVSHLDTMSNRIRFRWLYMLAADSSTDILQIQMANLFHHPCKPSVVVGTRSIHHLREAIAIMGGRGTQMEPAYTTLLNSACDRSEDTAETLLKRGVGGPFRISDRVTSDELKQLAQEAARFARDFDASYGELQNWHHYHEIVAKICNDPQLQEQITSLLGEVVCYNTELFVQFPNSQFEPTKKWHADQYGFVCNDSPHFTVQVALTPTFDGNCLSFLEGSHLRKDEVHSRREGDASYAPLYRFSENEIESWDRFDAAMQPGEFVVFSNDVLHAGTLDADKVPKDTLRVGLSLRLAHATAEIDQDSGKVGNLIYFGESDDALVESLWAAVHFETNALDGEGRD